MICEFILFLLKNNLHKMQEYALLWYVNDVDTVTDTSPLLGDDIS